MRDTHHHIHIIDVQNTLNNYIFILEDTQTHDAVVIDPTESQCVLDYCQKHQLNIKQIWITHHHHDHTAGIAGIIEHFPVPVYAPSLEKDLIPHITHPVLDNDSIYFNDWQVDILETGGHTLGHISYFIDALDVVFCGDTLFVMGCGRVFDGHYQQLYHSLNRLSALPARTLLYCSHEYTLNNAEFALTVEPHNLEMQQRAEHIKQLRQQGLPTVPTKIDDELKTNPFLRVLNVHEFEKLRIMKDNF